MRLPGQRGQLLACSSGLQPQESSGMGIAFANGGIPTGERETVVSAVHRKLPQNRGKTKHKRKKNARKKLYTW